MRELLVLAALAAAAAALILAGIAFDRWSRRRAARHALRRAIDQLRERRGLPPTGELDV